MGKRKRSKTPSRKEVVVDSNCDLRRLGICKNAKCDKKAHDTIVMEKSWILNNVNTYIKKMLTISSVTGQNYMEGATHFLKGHKEASSIDIRMIYNCFTDLDIPVECYITILSFMENGIQRFLHFFSANVESDLLPDLKRILDSFHVNVLSVPAIRKSYFSRCFAFYAKNPDYSCRDSIIAGIYDELDPELRKAFYNTARTEFGDSFPLCRRLAAVYHLPSHPKTPLTKQQKQRCEAARKASTISLDSYRLPSNVVVHFINSIESLHFEVPSMMMERVLGWDCETFDPVNTKEPPATIQISGKDQVWLVDGIWLREEKVQKEANEYFALVVQNYDIFHAFMGKNDVEYLRRLRSMPCFCGFINVVDIEQAVLGLGMKRMSLSLYCTFFLDAPLDKTMTLSDWSQRPLHYKQVYYAALDAYVTRMVLIRAISLILHNATAADVKEKLERLGSEKASRMSMKKGETETEFEARKRNAVKDLCTYRISVTESVRSRYEHIVKGCEDYE